MSDDHLLSTYQPPGPRQPNPGEKLFEFDVDAQHYHVELRDHGEFGVEAQFLVNNELWQACRFMVREAAVRWAETKRAKLLRGEPVEWP